MLNLLRERKRLVLALWVSVLAFTTKAAAADDAYARKLYERLIGVQLEPNSPRLDRVKQMVDTGDFVAAANQALTDKRFYGVRMLNFMA